MWSWIFELRENGSSRVERRRSGTDLARAVGHLVNRADEESACPGRPTRKGIRISSGAETALMRIGGPDPAMPDHSPPGDPGIEPPVGQISVSENEQEPAVGPHSVSIDSNRMP